MKRRPRHRGNKGFTLLEILIAVAIGFVVVILTYRTLYTVVTVSSRVQITLASSQERMRFLSDFSRRLLASSRSSPTSKFEPDRIVFEITGCPVPVTVTYTVEDDGEGGKQLRCEEEQEIFDSDCEYVALSGCDDISFSYSDGGDWKDSWDSDKQLCAVMLTFSSGGSETRFPVVLTRPSSEESEGG